LDFYNKIKILSNGCWGWQGSINGSYGRIPIKGKYVKAHRVFYNFEYPEFPIENKDRKNDLDHLCRNRICVNPEHLEPVTQRKNVYRGLRGKLNKNHASEYPGVSRGYKDKWRTRIMIDGKSKYLGSFNTPEEAYREYERYRLL